MQLEKLLGDDEWGVCAFADALPLLGVRSRNRIPEDAKSVIILLFGYYVGEYTNRNLSRYAIVDDYHVVVRAKLDELAKKLSAEFFGERFIPFVDTSPVDEVRAAALAGLGDIGRNGLLLNKTYGSRCFIGELVTTLALPPSAPAAPLCTRCGVCIAACPSGALSEKGFDKELCRSHFSQKKGKLNLWEQEQLRAGGFVWGCDRCSDACPVNRNAQPSRVPEFYRDIQPIVGYDNAAGLCGSKAYGWRGENLLIRNLDIIFGKNML